MNKKPQTTMQDVYKALCKQNITAELAQWLAELDSDICDLKKKVKALEENKKINGK